MDVRLARWDLVDEQGQVRPVLRLVADGVPLSDPGVDDCFATALVAAEAAHLLVGAGAGAWSTAADDALKTRAEGLLYLGEETPVRVLGPAHLDEGRIGWLTRAPGSSLAGETGRVAPVDDPLDDFLTPPTHDGAPLSAETRNWPLASAAGAGSGDEPAPARTLRPLDDSDEPLSGRETRNWQLIDIVGEAAGKRKK